MRRFIVFIVAISSATAYADEDSLVRTDPRTTDRGFVAGGFEMLMDAADSGAGLGYVEGAYRLPQTSLLIHGLAAGGTSTDGGNDTKGTVFQARAGLELDTCSDGRGACGFLGFDVGYQLSNVKSLDTGMTTDTSRGFGIGRIGFDAGNDILRWRMALEIGDRAVGIQLALAHRFE